MFPAKVDNILLNEQLTLKVQALVFVDGARLSLAWVHPRSVLSFPTPDAFFDGPADHIRQRIYPLALHQP